MWTIPDNNWRVSIAPMMGYTDRHYRYLMRLMTKKTRLYTEMVTTGALLHGDQTRLLAHCVEEMPLGLQLGGSDPSALASCAQLAESVGYAEVNLNVGCPSHRVQRGRFGACLMKTPELVADCVASMIAQVNKIPISVKTRLGVDEVDSYSHLSHFVDTVAQAGCKIFIIHARKAWLKGLSPKENRDIPPLCYEKVYQLKQDFPALTFIINGGISLESINTHLQKVDGVMLGRSAYADPYLFSQVDKNFFHIDKEIAPIREVALQYLPYVAQQVHGGVPVRRMLRHLLNLYQGSSGARFWRRSITEFANQFSSLTQLVELESIINDCFVFE